MSTYSVCTYTEIHVTPYTRYFWKELTDDGRFISADWANEDGYDHSDAAIVHFHMKFSIDPYSKEVDPKWHLMKLYGIQRDI